MKLMRKAMKKTEENLGESEESQRKNEESLRIEDVRSRL